MDLNKSNQFTFGPQSSNNPTNLFSKPTTTNSSFTFGQTTGGTSQGQQTGTFGVSTATPALFGTGNSQPTTTGSNMFGNQQSSTGLFSSNTNPNTQSSGGFFGKL